MSLINDALKKAQKQRTGEAPPLASLPGVGGQSAASISRRAKPAGFDTLVLRAGIGAGVLLVLVVGGYFAFRSSPQAQPSAVSTQPSAPSPVAQSPSPSSAQPAATPPAPAFTLQIAPKSETPEPVVAKVEPPKATALPPSSSPTTKASVAQPSTTNSQPVSAAPPPKLEPRAMQFIDNIKVAGIRASGTDSKVLMNDRVYRLGDIVEHEMGLKLTGITSSSLTFEDERGGRYTRTF